MLLGISVLVLQQTVNKLKIASPGSKFPCSSARIEVAGADQVRAGPHIRLIDVTGSGFMHQQVHHWNCRAECSAVGQDHPRCPFCLCHPLRGGRAQEQDKWMCQNF